MNTICGANCENCPFRNSCKGCEATCGRPFGGSCTAAEYIRQFGREAYDRFKADLLGEVNALLRANGLPEAKKLTELPGFFIDLSYPLPSGERVSFLDGKKVYLGTQIELPEGEKCCGVAADGEFILLCLYGAEGADPELIAYQKRRG